VLAEQTGAQLVLANDPDADRLAAAARDGGVLRVLSGNDLGALLTDYVLARATDPRALTVIASIVSSPLIGAIARSYGTRFEPTLTGFKWIENRALELEREQGLSLALGVEEALGYSVGTLVRDKDGISAARVTAELAAGLFAQGHTLCDALNRLHAKHGVHASHPFALRAEGADGAERMAEALARLRSAPPDAVAGHERIGLIDLLTGRTEGSLELPRALPATDALFWQLASGARIAIRPSGTEPKLKIYLDLRTELRQGELVSAARSRLAAEAKRLENALRALLSG
jgi:phosphomannomutase